MATEKLSTEIALLERKAKESKNAVVKKSIQAKISRLKEELKNKSTTSESLSALSKAKKKISEMTSKEFNEMIKKLSEKEEFRFLKSMTKDEIKRDIKRTAKPVGWRFRGGDNFKKPTKKDIRENNDVYYESRVNRSDVSRSVKLSKGGGAGLPILTHDEFVKLAKEKGYKNLQEASLALGYRYNGEKWIDNRNIPYKKIKYFKDGGGVGEGKEIEFFNEGNKEKAKARKYNDAFYEITEGKHKGSLVHVNKVIKGYAKGGAISVGNNVRINSTGETMKVKSISKNEKGYVEFSGDKGSFLIGDIEKMATGGGVEAVEHFRLRGLSFLKDDLMELKDAIQEKNQERIDKFFSYWGQHLDKLQTTNNERMFNFLKDDLGKLENAIQENDQAEIEMFFSYWERHLESLKYAKGGGVGEKYELKVLSGLSGFNDGQTINGLLESMGLSNYIFNKYATKGEVSKVESTLNSLIKKQFVEESGIGYKITQKGADYLRGFDYGTYAKGGSTEFGMLSVKAGIDNNPNPTYADKIAGAKMKKMADGGNLFEGEMHRAEESGMMARGSMLKKDYFKYEIFSENTKTGEKTVVAHVKSYGDIPLMITGLNKGIISSPIKYGFKEIK